MAVVQDIGLEVAASTASSAATANLGSLAGSIAAAVNAAFVGEDIAFARLRVLAASPIDARAARVWLSEEPRRTSAVGPQDGTNRLSWTVALTSGPLGASSPVVERVENVRAAPAEIPGAPDAWSVDLRFDRPVHARATYLVIAGPSLLASSGRGLDPAPFDRASFPGVAAPLVRALRSQATRGRAGGDIAYDFFGGLFVLTAGGDLDAHAGEVALKKRILRRLTTARGGFAHMPDYGLGLVAKELRLNGTAAQLAAEAEAQISREEGVAAVRVDVDDQTPGLLVLSVAVQTRDGLSVDLSIGVPDGGPIEIGGL